MDVLLYSTLSSNIESCSFASLSAFGFTLAKHFGRFLKLFNCLRLPMIFSVLPRRPSNFSYSVMAWFSCRLLAHLAGIRQHSAFVEAKEFIELLLPVFHEHLLAPLGLILGNCNDMVTIRFSPSTSSSLR